MLDTTELRITEIFYSLRGETTFVGIPTVFVRLTGCPLRCQYCDTAYAFNGGQRRLMADVLAEVQGYRPSHVTVTGGEPLVQKSCLVFLQQLCDLGYVVSLETSGALPIHAVDSRVHIILDIKTPGSRESERNLLSNLAHIRAKDQIKFVICDYSDYQWSKQVLQEHQLESQQVLFSPSHHQLKPELLADWILKDRLHVRVQLQMHKYIWGDQPGK